MNDDDDTRRRGVPLNSESGWQQNGRDPGWDSQPGDDGLPADLSAVTADDALIDALISDRPVRVGSQLDHDLVSILTDWRHDVLSAPDLGAPTLHEVEAAIEGEKNIARRQRSLRIVKIVGAAAALTIVAFGGLTALSRNASPGDPLWSVKEVMFGKDASAERAVSTVQEQLTRAQDVLDSGDTATAFALANAARHEIDAIKDDATRAHMLDWLNRILAEIVARSGMNLVNPSSPSGSTLTLEPTTPNRGAPPPATLSGTTPPTSPSTTPETPTTPSSTSSENPPPSSESSQSSTTYTPHGYGN